MTRQLTLEAAFTAGEKAAEQCSDNAERSGWDKESAKACVLAYIRTHGPCSGEDATDAAVAAGHKPHDMRAFGTIYAELKRDGLIRRVGYAPRRKGHGSPGPVWGAT